MAETTDKRDMWPDEDELIYVSDETYHKFNRALLDMEIATIQLKNARDKMQNKQVEN
ncbi:MAG: hypothetical protein LBR68_03810 [Lachnoclostridium sp.]|jgi:hypothetical protein|nr:hypothetical protein [Lachnoclostridium sp.]